MPSCGLIVITLGNAQDEYSSPWRGVSVRREAGIGKGGCRQSQIGPGQTTVLGFGLEWGKGADMGFPQQWEMAYAA